MYTDFPRRLLPDYQSFAVSRSSHRLLRIASWRGGASRLDCISYLQTCMASRWIFRTLSSLWLFVFQPSQSSSCQRILHAAVQLVHEVCPEVAIPQRLCQMKLGRTCSNQFCIEVIALVSLHLSRLSSGCPCKRPSWSCCLLWSQSRASVEWQADLLRPPGL